MTAGVRKRMGLRWLGSEISKNQVKWAEDRLADTVSVVNDCVGVGCGRQDASINLPEQSGNLEQVVKLD